MNAAAVAELEATKAIMDHGSTHQYGKAIAKLGEKPGEKPAQANLPPPPEFVHPAAHLGMAKPTITQSIFDTSSNDEFEWAGSDKEPTFMPFSEKSYDSETVEGMGTSAATRVAIKCSGLFDWGLVPLKFPNLVTLNITMDQDGAVNRAGPDSWNPLSQLSNLKTLEFHG